MDVEKLSMLAQIEREIAKMSPETVKKVRAFVDKLKADKAVPLENGVICNE